MNGASIPKTRPAGQAAVLALPGWGDSERTPELREGANTECPLLLRRMGKPECVAFMRFLGNLVPTSCLLPAGIGPAPADPRGAGGSAGSIVPTSFQVWLCLSVMSACLTGTRPSSGVRDGMGVLEQARAGMGDGQGTGNKSCLPGVRAVGVGGGWEESVPSTLQVRTVPSETGSWRLRHARGGEGPGAAGRTPL